jgi:hypothetical protein
VSSANGWLGEPGKADNHYFLLSCCLLLFVMASRGDQFEGVVTAAERLLAFVPVLRRAVAVQTLVFMAVRGNPADLWIGLEDALHEIFMYHDGNLPVAESFHMIVPEFNLYTHAVTGITYPETVHASQLVRGLGKTLLDFGNVMPLIDERKRMRVLPVMADGGADAADYFIRRLMAPVPSKHKIRARDAFARAVVQYAGNGTSLTRRVIRAFLHIIVNHAGIIEVPAGTPETPRVLCVDLCMRRAINKPVVA